MHRFLLCLLPFALSLGFAGQVTGQDIAVEALVSETTIGTEESVTYSIEIKGASFADLETPEPPPTEGLALAQSVPSTQRNITFINGELQQSVTFQWSYRPLGEGQARFGPVEVTVSGETYRTEPIRLTVVPQAQRPRRTTPSNRGFPSRSPSSDREERPSPEIGEDELFIRARPSTRSAYQNEQITIEYQLYFRDRVQPRHSRLADSWDAEGFWKEELNVDTRPIPRSTVLNGLRYNTIVLKRVAAFPTRTGSLEIDPLRIETEVFLPYRSQDPFDRFFSRQSSYTPVELASPTISVDVNALPDDAPPFFRGAVGKYTFSAHLDRSHVEVGESVQLEIEITGTGNLATLDAPPFEAPGVFEQYDPQVTSEIDRSGNRIRGTKTFTYMLVPRSNGTFELPPIQFAYFDPEAERYRTARSDLPPIRVTGTATTVPAASTTNDGLPVDDIARPITETASWVALHPTPLYRNVWVYVALLLPLLVIGGVWAYQRHARRLATDISYARRRRAHPVARKHLKQAETLLVEDQPRAFYEEVERAVLSFIGNRLNLAERGLTRSQLDRRLAHVGIDDATRSDLHRLLVECDQMRFSPTRPGRSQMDTALDQAHRLIALLDEAFNEQVAAASTSPS